MNKIDDIVLSIIVPVYNVEKYIKQCVDSLIAQTISGIEIILVDDGSTDDSPSICDKYKKMYSNIYVIHKKNEGLGSARNAGIREAKGKYIGFVDSDDYVSENMYQILLDLIEKNDADCAYCELIRFWDNKAEVSANNSNSEVKIYSDDQIMKSYLLDRVGCKPSVADDCTYGASVNLGIFKRNLIMDNNIKFVSEREFIAEDMIFDIDIIPYCKKIVHTNNRMYFYRFNPSSLTTHYVIDRFERNVELCHEMGNRLSQIYDSNIYEMSLKRYFLKITRVSLIEEIAHLKYNGWKKAKKNICRIVNNDELIKVLESYPINLLPLMQRVFFWNVRNKNYLMIAILIKLNMILKKNGQEC